MRFGSACPLRWKGHYKSIQSYSKWSPLSYDETFLFWREWCFLISDSPLHKGKQVYQIDQRVWKQCELLTAACHNQIIWTSIVDFWWTVLDSLCHHDQNSKWGKNASPRDTESCRNKIKTQWSRVRKWWLNTCDRHHHGFSYELKAEVCEVWPFNRVGSLDSPAFKPSYWFVVACM